MVMFFRGEKMGKYIAALYNRIKSFSEKKRISFHMPVHMSGALYGDEFCRSVMDFDLTELDATDNLAAPSDVIKVTHENMATLFGADNAHILVGGSSGGIHGMLLSCLCRGDKIIVDRCAHISVINACMLYGFVPIFADREIDNDFMIPKSLSEKALCHVIKMHPEAKAVLVTNPTYYGICSPIESLAKIAHENGMAFLVDAAHGSHFAFSDKLPPIPTECGADMCVLSLHKTLGAPTQTALLLHKSDMVGFDKVKKCINMVHTTSPSYIFMCAADKVCEMMAADGEKYVQNMIDMTMLAKDKLKNTACRFLHQQNGDISRLVINFSAYNISGYEVSDILGNKYGIDVEMADFYNVVCITGPMTSENDIDSLARAIEEIVFGAEKGGCKPKNINIVPFNVVKNPCDVFASESEYVPVCDAKGRVCASIVSVYPPGVACLVPGAEISEDIIEYIKNAQSAAASVTGLCDGKILVVK